MTEASASTDESDVEEPKRTLSSDGGRAALAGFVYQFLTTAGESLRLLTDGYEAAGGRAERVALAIYSEFGDQDAAVEDCEGKLELLQMKFSSDRARSFSVSEAKEIITAIRRSKESLGADASRVSAYRLVTNRTSSEAIHKVFKSIPSSWFKSGTGAATKRVIRDSLTFDVVEGEDAREGLLSYLRALGCLGTEPDRAVTQLIGTLLEQGARPTDPGLDRPRLNKIFFGSPDARPLGSEGCSDVLLSRLDHYNEDNDCPEEDLVLHRPALAEGLTRLCEEHARIVVTGKGGVGKTAFLSQWARGRMDEADTVLLDSVRYATSSSWLASQLAQLLGFGTAHDRAREDNLKTLSRLDVMSNAMGTRPILFVALDAADESPRALDALKELWDGFRELERGAQRGLAPPATLIVSCRDIDSHGMRTLLRPGPLPDSDRRGFDLLEVQKFGDDEIERLEAKLEGQHSSPPPELLSMTSARGLAGIPLEVHEALRHPIMWRFYSRFPASTRAAIKDGEQEALWEWAEKALGWVCHRIEHRAGGQLRANHVATVLETAGRAGAWDQQGRFENSEFRKAANEAGLDGRGVLELLDQLDSSGLVELTSSTTRRWVYAFTASFLARGEDT
ncbi:MAG: hypothetical protein JJ863_17565 [Deltaproteobacteria bacterium]|nr:hypothetical protein [Deltaproteobacteria bacterium]